VRLAQRLAEIAPAGLSVAYFCNSGTEAIEGAVKLARKATRRLRLIAFRGGYHGDTIGALSLCDNSTYRAPFEPLLGDVEFLPFDDGAALTQIDERVAAVVVEPIQGEGGVRVPGPDFLPALRARCDATGALLVFDEVMTGFGRTGSWFAGQQWNVTPDVLVLAKALGGGLPLGAFMGPAGVDVDALARSAAGARHDVRRPSALLRGPASRRWRWRRANDCRSAPRPWARVGASDWRCRSARG
jgi:acetylornithine/succinyldiaminopimelate/putrescine aminotransferase